jgi:hypothetical protein
MKFISTAACVSDLDLSNTDPDNDVLMNPDLKKIVMGKKFTHLQYFKKSDIFLLGVTKVVELAEMPLSLKIEH